MTPITLSRQRHRLLVECLADRAEPVARSPRFAIYDIDPDRPARSAALDPDDIILVHDFARCEIDNNIGGYVADELLPLLTGPGRSGTAGGYAASEQALFERFVGEIVRSVDGNERRAWHLYYDNTLAALRQTGRRDGGIRGNGSAVQDVPQDFIADFAAIYRRVEALVAEVAPATVFDVATCFGFLPLLLASGVRAEEPDGRRPCRIVACDLNPALVSLADDYARHRRLAGVRFLRADILAADMARELAPLAPSFDVVTAIHLLEHLEPEQTGPAMDALWSLTQRRLIVAVPVEETPDARFGHRQVFDRESLGALGPRTGGTCRCFEDHGAWLVIDRPQSRSAEGEGPA